MRAHMSGPYHSQDAVAGPNLPRVWIVKNTGPHNGATVKTARLLAVVCFLVCLVGIPAKAQYKGDHIPGVLGLDSGTQAPPGIYVGDLVWVYPTSTVKDNQGNKINGNGSLTSTIDLILVSYVTNWKLFGANIGGQVGIPFIKNRLQLDSLDANTGFGFTDMILTPINLGWHLNRADITTGYTIYFPTGRFQSGGTDNTGLGMYGNELSLGTTVHLDQKKTWNAAANFALEFHTNKSGTNINVGDMATIEGGLGKTFYKKVSGPIPMITKVGLAGYSQFKVTGDGGSDIPPVLRGFKDRVFALGPEINTYIPKPRLTLLLRYEPEFGARNRTQGQTIVVSVVWVAKSLVKQQP
jgi:hypothetical protein